MKENCLFEKFPKTRPTLSPKIEKIYISTYKKNREGKSTASSLSQKMESWLHTQVSKDIKNEKHYKTLEIGAGTLNHLSYEKADHYDIIEPFNELYEDSPYLQNIKTIYSDISELELKQTYDRIISIATFEHILNLPDVVAKSALLLNPSGTLRTSIPNEGSMLWTLGWKITTGLEFRLKHGANYGEIMKHGHVNNAKEIEEIIRYFYKDVTKTYLGISPSLSLYKFFSAKNPDIESCKKYLERDIL